MFCGSQDIENLTEYCRLSSLSADISSSVNFFQTADIRFFDTQVADIFQPIQFNYGNSGLVFFVKHKGAET